jgi:hypothetical protein
MDHHCPWVGGCVGFNNHKLFVQFLVYTFTGCVYTAITMGIYILAIADKEVVMAKGIPVEFLITASVLGSALSIAIVVLMFTHLYFISTN